MLIIEKRIKSTFEAVHEFVMEAADKIKGLQINHRDNILFKINIMLREVLNNAVEHGNNFDETKNIYCKISLTNDIFHFEVQDEGDGFVVNEFFVLDDGFAMKTRSRGLELIEKYGFEYKFNNNKVIVKYDLNEER